MKYKTTQKNIKATHTDVISIGYCNLQRLLACERPAAYTTRAEGWGADIYSFGATAITTGYAPFGNIKPSYALQQAYEGRAAQITNNYSLSYTQQKQQLRALISEFIAVCTAGKEVIPACGY